MTSIFSFLIFSYLDAPLAAVFKGKTASSATLWADLAQPHPVLSRDKLIVEREENPTMTRSGNGDGRLALRTGAG